MLGGEVAGELLGEVLHHVVAFGLTVHQDVDPGLLLEGEDLADLVLDALLVPGPVDPPRPQIRPRRTQLGGLRERPDGRRRQQRQPQMRPLSDSPLRIRLRTAAVRIGDRRRTGTHRRVAGDGRAGTGGQIGPVRGQFGRDGVRSGGQTAGQGDDLGGLLAGEGEPTQHLRVDVPLRLRVQRDMQQGAGGGDIHLAGKAQQRAESGQGLLVVVDPDVAAVDDTGDQPLTGQPPGRREVVEVARAGLGEVERETVDGGLGQDRQRLAEPPEVGGDQQLGPVGEGAEVAVGAGGGVQLGRGAVLDERGLIQLHPFRTGRTQIGEDFGVHGQEPVQQGQRLEVGGHTGSRLGEKKVRDRADEHRARGVAQREGLLQLRDLLGGVGREHRVRAQLGHQIVVVRVEPLRHLQRRDLLVATRHREVAVERVRVHRLAVPLRDRADHDAGVQDVVVVREITGRDLVDAGVGELLPVGAAQVRCGLPEGVRGDAALPVTLDGLLQFTVLTLTGVAVHGGACCRGCGLRCHGTSPSRDESLARRRTRVRRDGETGRKRPRAAKARPSVWCERRPALEVTGIVRARNRPYAGSWQVFGLAGTS
ncbi:hypothetical protein A3Q37_06420 [Streptomyces sp. PTY087I2]|nr:hypothetical protein A3Q37_06420 [Streptomyces sp. PTY087I2]